MTTADFQATTTDDAIDAFWYIEIEGIRRRYGLFADNFPSWGPTTDTGTTQVFRDWFTDFPDIKGQRAEPLDGTTEPHEFTVRIEDNNDELTELFSVFDTTNRVETTLAAAVTAGDAFIDVVDSTGLTAPVDVYVNRETMNCTNVSVAGGAGGSDRLTVTRGMYGSTDSDHPLTDSQGNTINVAVTDKPTYMHTREVILCENRKDLTEADSIKIHGYLDSIVEKNGYYELTAAGYLRRVSCRIGATLAETTLERGLWSGETSANIDTGISIGQNTTWCIDCVSTTDFQSSGHVVIDSEIIKYVSKTADLLRLWTTGEDNKFDAPIGTDGRGIFNKEVFGPSVGGGLTMGCRGWDFNPIYAFDRDGNLDVEGWFWKPWFMEGHSVGTQVRQAIHSDDFSAGTTPAAVILTLLTSIDGDTTNGTYDVLPAKWGAGIDDSRIDVTGIEDTCEFLDSLDLAPFCIPEPVDCKEWLEEHVLRPCHLFFVEDSDGKITVKRLYSKNAAIEYTTPTTIDEDVLAEIPRLYLDKMPIGEFKINLNWQPGADKYWGEVNVYLGDTRDKYLGTARNFEIDVKTIYDWRLSAGQSWRGINQGDLPTLMDNYLQVIWQNHAQNPCPEIEFTVPYNRLIDVEVGQVCQVTCSVTPDFKGSARGITSEYFQIVETMPDPSKSTITCVAWMIGVNEADTRLLAPSAKITAYTDPSPRGGGAVRLTCEPSEFADGDLYTYDTEAFAAGDKIILVDSQYIALSGAGAPEVCTIDEVGYAAGAGNCWIDLTTAPTDLPGAGDYVDTAPYDSCVAAQKAAWAFMADTTPTLGAAGDDAHKRDR